MNSQSLKPDQALQLNSLGFSFHPFERFEASTDPYIQEYLIGHEMFAIAWEKKSTALFAPAGGGKTAMRIYTLRACWLSEGQRLKFPIAYDLPFFLDPGEPLSLAAHKTALAGAAATDILLACAYRPELYLELKPERRARLAALLQDALPGDLSLHLGFLQETGDPPRLSAQLDRSYLLPVLADRHELRDLTQAMLTGIETAAPLELEPAMRCEALLEFIRRDLGFEAVFILLDGVDGMASLARDVEAQFHAIEPLCQQSLAWAQQGVFLKAFLPLELEDLLTKNASAFYRSTLHAAIAWDVPKLAEILRRRVYVASQGKFGSLDALSSPALRDVETLIAQYAQPLPREAIVLAGKALDNFMARSRDAHGYLEPEDLELADRQYRRERLSLK